MFKYNNTHVFTGYLKQLLSSFNLPNCRVYTHEFAKYLVQNGTEDPRVLGSFDRTSGSVRINYLKNNEIYHYYNSAVWRRSTNTAYSSDKSVPNLTHSLSSQGISYDTKTHEYLGDYLRFIRDYYNIDLMSLYNCFTDKIYNNIHFTFKLSNNSTSVLFNTKDPGYRIYAMPVKLFAKYTVAIDCSHGIELFCGFYNTNIDMSDKAIDLAKRTYQKINNTLFSQPFLYDKLGVENWSTAVYYDTNTTCTRWDLANREKDLKLFIKVPVSCKSTITILEGDYRTFNDVKYAPVDSKLVYKHNHSVLNFNTAQDHVNLNDYAFKPISKLQLLAFNTGESYPFADRLVEYLSGSAITPMDEISDNIKRVQHVMKQTGNYFKIEGLWENKMQNILYDYMMNSGPIEVKDGNLIDKHSGISPIGYGYHPRLGHTTKSTRYDILGYVDKDTEKLYASWKNVGGKAMVGSSLQNIDIYNGLYDV